MKFVELANDLKKRLAPVYLVDGDEAFFRDRAVGAIRAACNISQPTLNDVRAEGETLKGDKLVSFCADLYTLPFFDEKRLVRACDFYPNERDFRELEKYLKAPCPTTVLVIVNTGKKAGTVDLTRKSGILRVDCNRESEENLTKWLFGVMRRAGLSVDVEAASLMVRYCARDAARMKNETEKLRLLLGEGGRVTCEVVDREVAKDAEYRLYELTQAASRGNRSAFSVIAHDLMEKGFDEYALLSALASHYRTLYEVTKLRGTDAETASVLGIQPYAVKKNREAAARLGREKTEELFTALYALSAGARSGAYTKTGAFSMAVAKIFFD